jgi:signal peptidase
MPSTSHRNWSLKGNHDPSAVKNTTIESHHPTEVMALLGGHFDTVPRTTFLNWLLKGIPIETATMADAERSQDKLKQDTPSSQQQVPSRERKTDRHPIIPFLSLAAAIVWLACIYLMTNFVLPQTWLAPQFSLYVVQPLMWGSLIVLIMLLRRLGAEAQPSSAHQSLVVTGLMAGAVHLAVFAIAGIVQGFGHSPYSHQPLDMMGNIIYAGSALVAMEFGRAHLIRSFRQRSSSMLVLVLATLLFSYVSIPFTQFQSISDASCAIVASGETFLPLVSANLLASYLVFLGGPAVSIAYLGTLVAFEWLSPIQPNLGWAVDAFLGTLIPVVSLLVIQGLHEPEKEQQERESRNKKEGSPLGWVVIGIVAVCLIWFNTGLAGIEPTLVSGPSMNPTLWAGDVVLVKDVPPEEVQIGDLVRFQDGNRFVVHRVVETKQERGRHWFITRGDNTNQDDPPISERMLMGKVVLVIPKIGWVSIWARDLIRLIVGVVK